MALLNITKIRLPAVVLGAVLLIAACADNSPDALLTKAQDARDAQDPETATIHLKNILQSNPEHIAARILLGEVSLEMADPAGAENQFRRALELGAPLEPIQLPLARAILQQGRFHDVLEFLLEHDPQQPDEIAVSLQLRGEAHYALRHLEQAERLFEDAIAADPTNLESYTALARLMIEQNRHSEAEALVSSALDRNPEHVPTQLLKSAQHYMAGNYDESVAILNTIIERETGDERSANRVRALTQLAEVQLAQNELDDALQTVQRLRSVDDRLYARFLRARVAAQRENYDLATEFLHDLLRDAPDYPPAERLLGTVHAATGNVPQAELYLQRALIGDPQDQFARRLLAELSLRQNDPDRALSVLRPALDNGQNAELLSLAGQASLQLGDRDAALDYFQRSVSTAPDAIDTRLSAAISLMLSGDAEQAMVLLENVPDSDETFRAVETIKIIGEVRNGNTQRAIELAEQHTVADPQAVWPVNLLGAIHFFSSDYSAARHAFEQALALDPTNVSTLQHLARVDLAEGRTDAARQQLDKVLEIDDENYASLLAMATLEMREDGNRAKAEEILLRVRDAYPGALAAHLLLAQIYLEGEDTDAALAAATDANRVAPNNGDALNLQGLAHLQGGNVVQALRSFEMAIGLDDRQADYHSNLAQAQTAAHDANGAFLSLLRAFELDNGRLPPYDLLSRLNVDSALAPAEQLLDALKKSTPAAFETLFLEGALRHSQGDHADAADAYVSANALRPDLLLAIRLFEVRSALGRPDATAALESWTENNPGDADGIFSLAAAYEEIGNLAAAIRHYEAAIQANAAHAPALNNLAVLYHKQGDPRALSKAEKAYESGGDHPAILDTLGWINVESGDLTRGVSLLEAAAGRSSEPVIRYHLASAYTKKGDTARAKLILQELIKGDDFPGRADAIDLLDTLPGD